jgi:hypothetical protein
MAVPTDGSRAIGDVGSAPRCSTISSRGARPRVRRRHCQGDTWPSRVDEFLGGFPPRVYEARGFLVAKQSIDDDLARTIRGRSLASDEDLEAATVASCVLQRQ